MERVNEVYASASRLLRHGLPEQAAVLLNLTLEEQPDDAPLWRLLGRIRHLQGRFAEAMAALETATTLAPLSAEAQADLADCYLRSGLRESADAIYEHLASCDDLPDLLLPVLAAGLGRLGRFHRALEVCRTAAGRHPECDQALYGVAYYMGKCGYPAELVLPILHKAHELAPEALIYRVALATTYHRLGQTARGHAFIDRLAPQHLTSVRCAGCVRRLLEIYERMHDKPRRQICHEHLAALTREAA